MATFFYSISGESWGDDFVVVEADNPNAAFHIVSNAYSHLPDARIVSEVGLVRSQYGGIAWLSTDECLPSRTPVYL